MNGDPGLDRVEWRLRSAFSANADAFMGDLRRCESMIRDLCGTQSLEAELLIQGAKSLIPADLLESRRLPDSSRVLEIERLRLRLVDRFGTNEKRAMWAVLAWAFALNLVAAESFLDEDFQSYRRKYRDALIEQAAGEIRRREIVPAATIVRQLELEFAGDPAVARIQAQLREAEHEHSRECQIKQLCVSKCYFQAREALRSFPVDELPVLRVEVQTGINESERLRRCGDFEKVRGNMVIALDCYRRALDACCDNADASNSLLELTLDSRRSDPPIVPAPADSPTKVNSPRFVVHAIAGAVGTLLLASALWWWSDFESRELRAIHDLVTTPGEDISAARERLREFIASAPDRRDKVRRMLVREGLVRTLCAQRLAVAQTNLGTNEQREQLRIAQALFTLAADYGDPDAERLAAECVALRARSLKATGQVADARLVYRQAADLFRAAAKALELRQDSRTAILCQQHATDCDKLANGYASGLVPTLESSHSSPLADQ